MAIVNEPSVDGCHELSSEIAAVIKGKPAFECFTCLTWFLIQAMAACGIDLADAKLCLDAAHNLYEERRTERAQA